MASLPFSPGVRISCTTRCVPPGCLRERAKLLAWIWLIYMRFKGPIRILKQSNIKHNRLMLFKEYFELNHCVFVHIDVRLMLVCLDVLVSAVYSTSNHPVWSVFCTCWGAIISLNWAPSIFICLRSESRIRKAKKGIALNSREAHRSEGGADHELN